MSAGTGDNMGAAFGLCLEPGEIAVSVGTSGTAYAVTTVASADPSGAIAGFADATGRFLPLVCTINAALVLDSVAAGQDPDHELVAQHRTHDIVVASPGWTLEQAAAAMVRGGFRHLVVVEGHEVIGLLSMRDIVRAWSATRIPA